jgi:outer membrane protein assembly factor BamA
VLLAAGLCGVLPQRAWAQADKTSSQSGSGTVAEVKASGSKRFSEAEVVKASGIAPGATVTREDIQAAADRLSALGWFNELHYRFKTAREGVTIEFTMQDAPTVRAYFDNFPWFSEEQIAKALRDALGLYDGSAPEAGTAIDTMKETLEKLAASRGLRGQVEASLVAAPGEGGMVQQFRLAGPAVSVTSLDFTDPSLRDDKRLHDRISDIVGKPYSRFTIEMFAFEQVRPIYLSRGNLRVHFGVPETQFAGDPRKPMPDSVMVRLPIVAGPVFRWSGAKWSGNSMLDGAELDRLTGLTPGDPADGNRIQAAWDRISREYGRRGYIEMKMDPQGAFDEAASKVSYRVAISEGAQYRVGQIVITGLSVSAERQLLASWRLPRGEIFDQQYFEDFLATGIKKIFEDTPVHYATVGHLLRTNQETRLVDVLLDIQ